MGMFFQKSEKVVDMFQLQLYEAYKHINRLINHKQGLDYGLDI